MGDSYDPAVPNEIGRVFFTDDSGIQHTGVLIVGADEDGLPVKVELYPPAIAVDDSFAVVVTPTVGTYMVSRGDKMPAPLELLSKTIWWLTIDSARRQWKEALRAND